MTESEYSPDLRRNAQAFLNSSLEERYSYNFKWLGRPIIQYPQDIVATQEIIWSVRPDVIIETGIAHGGSLMLSASMLALLDYCDLRNADADTSSHRPRRRVVGVDVDIRSHNRDALEKHPMRDYIQMIEGSSVAPSVIDAVKSAISERDRVMVFLDSNHTHDHVIAELTAYAPLVTLGSYCVVFDTIVEEMPDDLCADRPWAAGNSPKTAVDAFMQDHSEFRIDSAIDEKLLISVAPNGYLKRIA